MVLIALSFIYITFLLIPLGYGFLKLIKAANNSFVINAAFGLFVVTLLASVWAFFSRINIEFHAIIASCSMLLYVLLKSEVKLVYTNAWATIQTYPKWLCWLLLLNTLLIVMQCAAPPTIFDNESYYIQTVKWLNEYGFVKGLGNLHIFLAQTSGWHIAQSALNFSFLYPEFNDLSGYCLLLGNMYSFQKINSYIKTGYLPYLTIGLFPVANFFIFQSVSAPSPDIPVFVFSFILFSLFIEQFNKPNAGNFLLIVCITAFTVYCKVTAAVLCLLPVFLALYHYSVVKKVFVKCLVVCVFVVALLIGKNYILTGYALYPLINPDLFAPDWKLPLPVAVHLLSFSHDNLENFNLFKTVLPWLKQPGLEGIFSKIAVLLVLLIPVIISKYFNKKAVWLLYAIMIIQFIVLLILSPQYRFYLNFLMLFSFFILAIALKKNEAVKYTLVLACVLCIVTVCTPVYFKDKKVNMREGAFKLQYSLVPHEQTKLTSGFKIYRTGNLRYYSPTYSSSIWLIGNAKLPAVNVTLLKYIKKKHSMVAQQRTKYIKDGFVMINDSIQKFE